MRDRSHQHFRSAIWNRNDLSSRTKIMLMLGWTISGLFLLNHFLLQGSWISELINPLSRHAIFFITAIGCFLLLLKQLDSLLLLLTALSLFHLTAPLSMIDEKPKATMEQTGGLLKILNFNSFAQTDLPDEFYRYLKNQRFDLLALIEFNGDAQAMLHIQSLGYSHFYQHRDPSPAKNIAIFSRMPLLEPKILFFGDGDLPAIHSGMRWEDQDLFFLILHLQTPLTPALVSKRNRYLSDLLDFCHHQPSHAHIMLGDFNMTPWDRNFRRIQKTCSFNSLSHAWTTRPTWPAGLGWFGIPIDHVLVQRHLQIQNSQITPSFGSDHHGQAVIIRLSQTNHIKIDY